jgi:hypothetical protein
MTQGARLAIARFTRRGTTAVAYTRGGGHPGQARGGRGPDRLTQPCRTAPHVAGA